ncbi:unnamed protein product [Didymodactylos carnosus]|uniref:N-acetyltransferase domain-containing protein n=1 Tax=Didymodactylos carnosus TaxID=1234261 RepID=A0A815IU40_9BILA|nr:unnamed protein product [Didymodactylos carnosus]CAF4261586.1 unnamed protein product [Didymodactylos carnosus]
MCSAPYNTTNYHPNSTIAVDSSKNKAYTIREANPADISQITEIYAHYVNFDLCTFEEIAPTIDEMLKRYTDITEQKLPYIVATTDNDMILGYAYAVPHRTRSAYRFTVEDSIYVSPSALRLGIGYALLRELIKLCTLLGHRQMVAVIADCGKQNSIQLHERLGFKRAGLLSSVGYKKQRWINTILMQVALGNGDKTSPNS